MWCNYFLTFIWFFSFWYMFFKGSKTIEDIYKTYGESWGYGKQVDEIIYKVKMELKLVICGNLFISFLTSLLGSLFKINLDFETIVLDIVVIVFVFGFYGLTEPACINYRGIPIDKKISLRIWNYLALKGDRSISKFDLFLINIASISINEIVTVKKSLKDLNEDDIQNIREAIELSKVGIVSEPTINLVKKHFLTVFTVIFSVPTFFKIIELLFKYFKSNQGYKVIKFVSLKPLLIIIPLIFIIVLWLVNNLATVNRCRQCNVLLKSYIDDELKRRNTEARNKITE